MSRTSSSFLANPSSGFVSKSFMSCERSSHFISVCRQWSAWSGNIWCKKFYVCWCWCWLCGAGCACWLPHAVTTMWEWSLNLPTAAIVAITSRLLQLGTIIHSAPCNVEMPPALSFASVLTILSNDSSYWEKYFTLNSPSRSLDGREFWIAIKIWHSEDQANALTLINFNGTLICGVCCTWAKGMPELSDS